MQTLRMSVFSIVLALAGPFAQAQTYTVFKIPGAQLIDVIGINAGGEIAGSWDDAAFVYHGFIRSSSGTITNVDVPGAVATFIYGINLFGDTVGSYTDIDNIAHGFKRDAGGDIELIDFPGAYATLPTGINDGGEIAGFLPFTQSNPVFIRDASETYTSFAVPGSMNVVDFVLINNGGYVAGNANHYVEAFFRTPQGKVLTSLPQTQPYVNALDDANEIGGYINVNPALAFVRIAGGKTETFQIDESSESIVSGLNESGVAVGYYWSVATSGLRGFTRTADGLVTLIDVPNCGPTAPTGVNASGTVAGACGFNGSAGFIYTP